MDNFNFGELYLSKEESRKFIELLAKERNTKNYKVNRAINYLKLLKKI